jgi:hypothetical protein
MLLLFQPQKHNKIKPAFQIRKPQPLQQFKELPEPKTTHQITQKVIKKLKKHFSRSSTISSLDLQNIQEEAADTHTCSKAPTHSLKPIEERPQIVSILKKGGKKGKSSANIKDSYENSRHKKSFCIKDSITSAENAKQEVKENNLCPFPNDRKTKALKSGKQQISENQKLNVHEGKGPRKSFSVTFKDEVGEGQIADVVVVESYRNFNALFNHQTDIVTDQSNSQTQNQTLTFNSRPNRKKSSFACGCIIF